MHRLVAVSLASVVALTTHSARAGTCASLALSDADDDVIIGEAGYRYCFGGPSPGCFFMPYSPAKLGVCRKADGGAWQIEILGCTTSSTSSDAFVLDTRGGDDRVAVLRDEHTTGYLDLLPAGGGTGAMYCGGTGDAIAPWNPNFDFTISATLGSGTDLYHGSDNRDVAWTNRVSFVGGVVSSPADSSSFDMVCTYGGNDAIYGDRDDDFMAGFEDWMDGGAGTDTCDGDYAFNGSDTSDLHRNCETPTDAYPDAGLNEIRCSESDDPLHDW